MKEPYFQFKLYCRKLNTYVMFSLYTQKNTVQIKKLDPFQTLVERPGIDFQGIK